MAERIIMALALGFIGVAGWMDWRSRRIPNWLTVPASIVGLLANLAAWGWAGAAGSLEGILLGLGILLPFVLLRGLGAGDWKLAGALGAFVQWKYLLLVLLGAIFIGGIMATVEVVRSRRVKETLLNLFVLSQILATFGIRTREQMKFTIDNPSRITIPFGVAVSLSMIFLLGSQILVRIWQG